ncbi:hypothetical protein [Nannocystis pusilla]|uniref:hypothetical protein n=1 Tax=Nannocystis pusilla TaxID=889268 RepID=UPI003B80254A
MPRTSLLLRAFALALPFCGAALTSPAITLSTCSEQVERMRRSFADLEGRLGSPHVQREDWPLPVSPAGSPMYGAKPGPILYGPSSDHEWPELARAVAALEDERRLWRGWGETRAPEPIYLALRNDVRLDKHWPALQRLAGSGSCAWWSRRPSRRCRGRSRRRGCARRWRGAR